MLIITIIFLALLLALYFVSAMSSTLEKGSIDQKEYKLSFLYPMSDYILTKLKLYPVLNKNQKVKASLYALKVTSKTEALQRLYWCSRVSLIILVLTIFLILSLLGQLQTIGKTVLEEGYYITRPKQGEGAKQVDLNAKIDQINTEEEKDKKGVHPYSLDIKIKIDEPAYSSVVWEQLLQEARDYLDISILANNSSSDLIYEDLYFCKVIPGTSITVQWQPEDTFLIDRSGTVKNDDINKKGVSTIVKAILSYQEREHIFIKELRVMPKQYSEEEHVKMELEKEIEKAMSISNEEKRIKLPEAIAEYEVSWKERKENSGTSLLGLGILTAVIAWFMGDQELNKKLKERKEQMLLDYPEIINKFTLLVSAGMTVKQAWSKITQDYEEKSVSQNHKKRYAYEEMLLTLREQRLGIPEGEAYEQFGRRIGLIPYMKFSTLIAQNLKKGNKGISDMLTKEAIEAFEERKETAKRLGEEAGTKLLAPMMIMLLLVFVIILVPAFTSFGF